MDPLLDLSDTEITEKEKMIQRHDKDINLVTGVMDDIRDLQADLKLVKTKLSRLDEGVKKELNEQMNTIEKELVQFKEKILGKEVQGIYRKPEVITSQLYQTNYLLDQIWAKPSPNQKLQLQQTSLACEGLVREFVYFKEKLEPLRALLNKHQVFWLE